MSEGGDGVRAGRKGEERSLCEFVVFCSLVDGDLGILVCVLSLSCRSWIAR